MLATCFLCNRDFLTEADPFVVRPTPDGKKLYCMCQIKGFDEMGTISQELTKLKEANEVMRNALQEVNDYGESPDHRETPKIWTITNQALAKAEQILGDKHED